VIAKQAPVVALEDLNIKGMIKNKKLSKAIADQGLGMFVEQLKYKTQVVQISRWAPSTKTCIRCDHVQPMSLNIRVFKCGNCGLEIDRDYNAALNIKRWGIDELNRTGTVLIYARGDTTDRDNSNELSSYVSLKQEKFESSGPEAKCSLDAW
jgi:putative transposase